MKPVQIFAVAAISIGGVALQGCSGGDHAAKEIGPGAFVRDEPVQLAHAKLRNSSRCVIDDINGQPPSKQGVWTVKRGDGITIDGWAYLRDGNGAPDPLFMRLTGAVQTYYAVTGAGGRFPRPDVNQEFKLDPSIDTGLRLQATISNVEPGVYAIAIMQPTVDRVESCELPVSLIVN
jgi:hypothetical protein